jgi:phage tail sheath gpL-like
MQSNAVSQSDVSAVIGYLLAKAYFNPSSPNLPQNISILAEANTANQAALSTAPQLVTSAAQCAQIGGWGSPIHAIGRILFPQNGVGVSCPVTVYPQLAASGSVSKVITTTQTGTATIARTIALNISGREQLDGGSYLMNVEVGDTPTIFSTKAQAIVASVLGCPVLGSGTATFVATAKWTGLTSNDIRFSIDQNPNGIPNGNIDPSVTFAVVNTTAGTGTPLTGGANNGTSYFANKWNTIVINSYGLVSSTMTELEAYNGVPDPISPTGQYSGIIMRPMWALSGTTLDNPTSITSAGARPNNVTIVPCVAPLSLGMPYEAAANVAYLIANVFGNNPESDVIGLKYPDMPSAPAGQIPAMCQHSFRQTCVTNGCSTVDYSGGATGNGVYTIVDLVTTYNVTGEYPPFYRYVRDLNVHFNYKFGYFLLQQINVEGKVLLPDSSTATADNIIKPGMWAAEVAVYNLSCEKRALLVNVKANNKTIKSQISSSNPNRLDTTQSVQISGITRIAATTVYGGFYFGSN